MLPALRRWERKNAFGGPIILRVASFLPFHATAGRLSPDLIGQQPDYWTFVLGPKFSKKERGRPNLSRFYAIAQIEYCRNFILQTPLHPLSGHRAAFTASTPVMPGGNRKLP